MVGTIGGMVALASLGATSCFDGADALGLPCREDADCGKGQRCEAGVCGGPTATGDASTTVMTSAESSSSGTSLDGSSSSSGESTGTLPGCGNGVIDEGEDCDPGTGLDAADCDADCSAVECGDGHPNLEAGEDCDDANDSDVDACTSECRATLLFDGMDQPGMWMTEIPSWTDPGSGMSFMLSSGWQHGLPEPGSWQSGVYSESSGTARLISPPIAFAPEPGSGFHYELRFRHRFRFDGNPMDVGPTACPLPLRGDGAVVWVMDEAGMPMQRVGPPPSSPDQLDDLGGCAIGVNPTNPLYEQGGPVYTSIINWTDAALPLPGVEGMTVRLVFEIGYDCANCWQSNAPLGAGWAIDDVVVAPFEMR
ncbi:hypothetical protein [Paraliomyxa miuraensis]|uniref:hypothetical protein n=1 Tax=Paraliomyxa miuraensis TaxID=376150 RepID=UPI002252CE9D|nr:hypothetical protein [Paraliomyxa miuraensis]MCX4240974.1 hypothetical protein [Paraliomyxa miuraensis]